MIKLILLEVLNIKTRNTNIELLRILSIIFIIMSHYTFHNGINNYDLPLSFNRFLLEIMTLGNIGTIIFILITGYYTINQNKNFNINKLFKLYLQIFFYSFGIYIIITAFGLENFNIKNLIKAILPITFNEYWFATVYFILYLFHPFLNKLLNHLNRKEHFLFIILGLSIFSVLSTLTTSTYYGNELIQFILFYSIGAYLSKYKNNLLKFHHTKLAIISGCLLILSVLCLDILQNNFNWFPKYTIYFFNRNSILAILFSISLFSIFINKKEFNNSLINKISSCVFGVYLISDNQYIRKFLWLNILKNQNYVLSNYLIIHIIISILLVFIISALIEYLRKMTIEKWYNKYCTIFIQNMQNKIKVIFEKNYTKITPPPKVID